VLLSGLVDIWIDYAAPLVLPRFFACDPSLFQFDFLNDSETPRFAHPKQSGEWI
jgi:hypothetical protein